jgi:hypothetical protein
MSVAVVALVVSLSIGCSFDRSAITPADVPDSAVPMDATTDSIASDSAADATPPDTTIVDTGFPDVGTGCPPVLGSDCRWAWRMRLDFDNSGQDEALTDFPVAVFLAGPRIDYGLVRDAGEDLRFVDSSQSQVLPHEIEVWNEAGQSIVWVRVPRIAANSSADHVWMYFGHPDVADGQDAESVWSDAFELVWHLSGSPLDSTAGDNDGSNMGSTNAAGRVGRGRAFDGAGQYIDSRYDVDLPVMTVEAWARGDDVPAPDENVGIVCRQTNYQLNWDHFTDFRGAFGIRSGDDWQAAPYLPVSGSTWYYLAGTYDGETIRAYKDGVLAGENSTPSGPPDPDTYPLRVGTNPDISSGWFFSGRIDEVRVSSVVRSEAWLRAQHLSMTDGFITYGEAESVTP